MYGFSTKVTGTLEDVRERVTAALGEQGFGVLTEIDVQAVFKKKLDLDRTPYLILGACNPNFAKDALAADPEIGLLLPCNVVLREDAPGEITVSFMDPRAVLNLVESPAVHALANTVHDRLTAACSALADA